MTSLKVTDYLFLGNRNAHIKKKYIKKKHRKNKSSYMNICILTSSHRMPINWQFVFQPRIGGRLNTHSVFFLQGWPGAVSTQRDIVRDDMYIHASVSRSPRGHGSVAPDKRHCRQWMSSLFSGFLPNPFIHDLFLWRTSQEFVKTDLYPLSLMSLRYAV